MKIGIFGGTFDPIHSGHTRLAECARVQFHLDKILFVPAFIPPHKTTRRDLTPAPYRYRMVELALREHPEFEISDVELSRPEVSFTVDTLKELKKRYPEDELFLILGADSLEQFSKWKDPAGVSRLVTLLAAPREGYALAAAPQNLKTIQMKHCPMESSAIREALKQRQPVPKGWLAPQVEDYIRKMKLYERTP